jgi:hypothetical protein
MNEQRSIERFQITIPRGHALRLLGIRKQGRRPRDSVKEIFEEEYAAAMDLIDASAVMCLSHTGLPGSSFIDSTMPLVVVVCTIGPALEERVTRFTDEGEAARALILDAIGSAAAEEVADQSNRMICQMAMPTDFCPDSRRSPGYGKWDIREQEAIFRFLEPSEIGVTLNESCMMVPRKSISYIVPLEGGTPGDGPGERCHLCGVEDCPYRALGDEEDFDWESFEGDKLI